MGKIFTKSFFVLAFVFMFSNSSLSESLHSNGSIEILKPRAATEYVEINGNVSYNSLPVCAMVLANGKYTFSSRVDGSYSLYVPLDTNGNVAIQTFCNKLEPKKIVFKPGNSSVTQNIELTESDVPSLQVESLSYKRISAERARISGYVTYNEAPLCAMALVNGKYMFTCDGSGFFDLDVAIDSEDRVILQVFCANLSPYKEIIVLDPFTNPLVGTYTLESFEVNYNSGGVLTEDDFNSWHGTQKLYSDGSIYQSIVLDGNNIIVEGSYEIISDSELKVSSGGHSYNLNYTYSNQTFTTFLPSGVIGNDFTETDVWTKVSSDTRSLSFPIIGVNEIPVGGSVGSTVVD